MPHSEATSPKPSDKLKQDSGACVSPSSYLGMTSVSPRSTPKSASSRHADTISPLLLGEQKSLEDFSICNGQSPRRRPVKTLSAHRLSGRPPAGTSPSLRPLTQVYDGAGASAEDDLDVADHPHFDAFVDQISTWVKEKRAKRSARKARRAERKGRTGEHDIPGPSDDGVERSDSYFRRRRGSDTSEESIDLDKLEKIIKQNLSLRRPSIHRGSTALKTKSSVRKLLRKQSTASDTEQSDGEFNVPTTDAWLDNSKTLAYTGGASELSDDSGGEELRRVPSYRDLDAWARFKFEIVRLAHTLRLKGWRKVPLEMSGVIEVQRLSGALTNAVYVVSPPSDLPLEKKDHDGNVIGSHKPPPKLLLRIYGPQVEHLIDREAELAILRRLCRKNIGPRLLGCFANGRFEEYLHAETLKPKDLRDPTTSRQIAKRMRELHDGIELLDRERSDGAFVWRNWDKWLQRVEQIVTWMDEQVRMMDPDEKPSGNRAWLRRGYICGVPWETFKGVVGQYRKWLEAQYGGIQKMQEQLVFAHNDTQYGNLLRLVPTGKSPLLLPANSHKQLVVIDFEYANANTPGLEFANHFTEWCYNYHDERKPYAFNANWYPTVEEQDRFIRAYVRHRPQFNVDTPKAGPTTPGLPASVPGEPVKRSTSSISEFMLDARTPQAHPTTIKEDEALKSAEDAEVERLMNETRKWRLANTAQWVVWGIVQAKVPGMPLFEQDGSVSAEQTDTEPEDLLGERAEEYKALVKEQQGEEEEEQEEEFDYLGYAQHRALFFWGDALQMGFIEPEALSEETRAKIKTVPH